MIRYGVGGVVALLVLGGCAERRVDTLRLGPEVQRPARAVVLMFVDGMRPALVDRMLAAGELPNLQRLFVAGGVVATHGIAALPPITYPNAATLITGLLPGQHGIVGNTWFDRYSAELREYDTVGTYRASNGDISVPTLFDYLDRDVTVVHQAHTRRHAAVVDDHELLSGLDWLLGRWESVDARVGRSLPEVAETARRVGRWPRLTMLYFPGLDEVGHEIGPASVRYKRALQNIDAQVGRVVRTMEANRPADEVYFVVVTDHGQTPIPRPHRVDLDDWIERQRPRKWLPFDDLHGGYTLRWQVLKHFDAVLIVGVPRRAVIHLRGPAHWYERPSVAEVEAFVAGGARELPLTAAPGVDLICYRDGDDRVVVQRGEARWAVTRRVTATGESEYAYQPVDGGRAEDRSDPLGYGGDARLAALTAAGFHDAEAWLAASYAMRYPDFVPQVAELFRSPRAGDIVLFARESWGFADDEPGGHGAAVAEDMCVRYFFRGPTWPAGGQAEFVRLADITPTILDALGAWPVTRPTAPRLFGRSRLRDLEDAALAAD